MMVKTYDVPTVDVYIELKMSLERIERREDQLLRKQRLNHLIADNEFCKQRREKGAKKKLSGTGNEMKPKFKLTRKPTEATTLPGRLFHGKTFNIVYNPDFINKTR